MCSNPGDRHRHSGWPDLLSVNLIRLEAHIEINKLVLQEITARKADRPRVLGVQKLEEELGRVRSNPGDTHDKAVALLTELVRGHPFASGNKRTAYVATKVFLERNGVKIAVKHDPRILQGIREGFYSEKEIRDWIKGHAIREFTRS